jgi:hypothetical protein
MMFKLLCSPRDFMGIPLNFGAIHHFPTASKQVPNGELGKESTSWILCNDFLNIVYFFLYVFVLIY